MEAIIYNSQGMELNSLEDIGKLIPKGYSGEPLNYGQGEGQVEISGTVWGFYVNSNNDYTIQYEEGNIDADEFIKLLKGIEIRMKELYGSKIQIKIQGKLNHFSEEEKYT